MSSLHARTGMALADLPERSGEGSPEELCSLRGIFALWRAAEPLDTAQLGPGAAAHGIEPSSSSDSPGGVCEDTLQRVVAVLSSPPAIRSDDDIDLVHK